MRDLKKNFLIIIPFIVYLIIYIFAIPNEPSHGWYRYPFYPFLLISSAVILVEEIKRISFVGLLFIFVVGLALLGNTWQESFGFSYVVYRLFILAAVISVTFPLWSVKKQIKNFKLPIIFLWLIFFIILNIWSVFAYIE